MNQPYTTSLEVSKRIKEIIGEQESYFVRLDFNDEYYEIYKYGECGTHINDKIVHIFLLSELPEVLKMIWKRVLVLRGHKDMEQYLGVPLCYSSKSIFLDICEIYATGQSVDDYLMNILK